MKIGIYDIVNNPLPQLMTIKKVEVNQNDFQSDEDIVNIFNKQLQMDKLNSEHIYALSLTYGLIPKGIIQVSVGKCDGCEANLRGLAIGLLLTGAEQFMCLHNHPGGCKNISDADIDLTNKYIELGNIIGIHFVKHIMITQNYFTCCINKKENDYIPFS